MESPGTRGRRGQEPQFPTGSGRTLNGYEIIINFHPRHYKIVYMPDIGRGMIYSKLRMLGNTPDVFRTSVSWSDSTCSYNASGVFAKQLCRVRATGTMDGQIGNLYVHCSARRGTKKFQSCRCYYAVCCAQSSDDQVTPLASR